MNNSRPVYSTDSGRTKPPPARTPARKPAPVKPDLPNDGVVRIFREKGGRGGKTVTVVRGISLPEAKLENLATELKRLCGAGGTVREGAIEVQGDHRERVAERLRALGHTVRLAGG